MSGLPYHKRYHSDALAGFMPLTLEERGAYQTLLDMIYDRGGPLIDNERLLAGYMNCSIRKWRLIRDRLIEKGKIRINADGMIANNRAEKEIENTTKTHRKLIEAGAKGGRKRAENEKKDNEIKETEQATLEPALSDPQAIPEARSQKKKASPKKNLLPEPFEPEPFPDGTEAAKIERSWSPDERRRQIEQFCDHHRANGNRFSDWRAAWGTWIRNSIKFGRSRSGDHGEKPRFMDTLREELERERRSSSVST